jgi:hypothetical protein
MIEPLRLTFEVTCSVEHAFRTWTSRIDAWWPADHTASGETDATIFLEPGVGGRLYERTTSGEEHDWGEVTRWDPPAGFAYLWHLRRDRADATDVDITFTAVDDGTRVDIVHSGWERLGDDGQTWRDRNGGGWATLLPHFQSFAERTSS